VERETWLATRDAIRAWFGLDKLPRYRVIDRTTGQVLQGTNDRRARFGIIESLID
jgi:hypothetical protein